MDAQRNDPCPCGSGLKHKHCCLDHRPWYKDTKLLGLGVALLVMLAVLVLAFASSGGAEEQSGPPYERPSGQAPPGKVWSSQHGHWHDAYQ